jgi:hypothetical protein
MRHGGALGIVALCIGAAALLVYARADRSPATAQPNQSFWPETSVATRRALRDALQPVRLSNCNLRRYGGPNDGGYLMCANLTGGVASAYSYGIDQEDNWGCDVSKQLGVPIHQYDCFTDQRPTCSGGRFVFHDECVGPRKETIGGQPFDTLTSQIARNGDAGKSLLVKIDIEGAEWESLLASPDAVLDTFVQLPMELHVRGTDESRFMGLIERLKRHFYLVNVHYNNSACTAQPDPLPALAFQTLWVNKGVGIVDAGAPVPAPVSELNARDNVELPDCQGD